MLFYNLAKLYSTSIVHFFNCVTICLQIPCEWSSRQALCQLQHLTSLLKGSWQSYVEMFDKKGLNMKDTGDLVGPVWDVDTSVDRPARSDNQVEPLAIEYAGMLCYKDTVVQWVTVAQGDEFMTINMRVVGSSLGWVTSVNKRVRIKLYWKPCVATAYHSKHIWKPTSVSIPKSSQFSGWACAKNFLQALPS